MGRAGAGLRVRAFHRPGFGLLVSVPRSLSTGVNVIALLSTFKLQRSRWFRIGLENTFPGFFSQEFFSPFFWIRLNYCRISLFMPDCHSNYYHVYRITNGLPSCGLRFADSVVRQTANKNGWLRWLVGKHIIVIINVVIITIVSIKIF